MWLSSILNSLSPSSAHTRTRRRPSPRKRPAAIRLTLEMLEERTVPSCMVSLAPSEAAPQLVGEGITWTGTGVGKFGPGGSVSYRGMLFFRTTSQKLARLNNACGAFEYEVDAAGNTVSKVWEWK